MYISNTQQKTQTHQLTKFSMLYEFNLDPKFKMIPQVFNLCLRSSLRSRNNATSINFASLDVIYHIFMHIQNNCAQATNFSSSHPI